MKAFGPFRLDSLNQCLWRAGERAALTPKAFDVLRYLVEHAERLVTQDELLEALWPETYVNPEGIRKYILEIRKVLGDRSEQPAFIETFPKRGYQFIAPVNAGPTPAAGIALHEPASEMVGRQEGIALLDGYLATTLTGQRQVVFVTGEPGIGKTTLVDFFARRAVRHPHLRIARGQCIEGFGGIEAYYPILEAISALARSEPDGSLIQALARHAPTWLIQLPGLVKPEQKESLQREIFGTTRERMVRELCELLEAITAQTSLLLILEDLHWVDPSTLDAISAISRRREPAKLLLIGTYRPVDVLLSQGRLRSLKQDLMVRRLCQEIAIERLEEPDVADYLVKTFTTGRIPPGLTSLIHRNSGGNPLFMVAIVQDMLNQGLITVELEKLVLTAPLEAVCPGIPETLQQMLEIQMAQMNSEELRILQGGCVSGERFSVWAVAEMLEVSAGLVEETCDALVNRQQLIRSLGFQAGANGEPTAHYEFRHALYRQALYRSLTVTNRSRLHRRLGERLLPVCNSGKPELASELALHFEEGRDYERAIHSLMLAAENAASRFSYRDSIHILRHALELVPSLGSPSGVELEIQILRRIGDRQYVLGEMSDAATSCTAAAELAAKAGLKSAQARALIDLSLPAWYLGSSRGIEVCRQALEISASLEDPLLAAHTRLAAASIRMLYDRWTEDEAELRHAALQVIRRLDHSGSFQEVYSSYVEAIQGNYQEAHRQADTLLATTTNPKLYVLGSGVKGLSFLYQGRFGGMRQILRAGLESAEKNAEDAWMYILGEAWLRLLCFDLDGARRVAGIVMRSDAEQHAPWLITISRLASAQEKLFQGDPVEARRFFSEVRDPSITPDYFLHWHWRCYGQLGIVQARLQAGELPDAGRAADEFLATALSLPCPNMRSLAWEMQSRVAIAVRDWKSARASLENALAILDRFDIPIAGWQVHRTAWELGLGEGNHVEAEDHRRRAEMLIRGMADSFEDNEPLRESLLTAPPVRHVLGEASGAVAHTSQL